MNRKAVSQIMLILSSFVYKLASIAATFFIVVISAVFIGDINEVPKNFYFIGIASGFFAVTGFIINHFVPPEHRDPLKIEETKTDSIVLLFIDIKDKFYCVIVALLSLILPFSLVYSEMAIMLFTFAGALFSSVQFCKMIIHVQCLKLYILNFLKGRF
jgi:hypothetical protein